MCTRYVSMDENVLRFDAWNQYKQLKQAYQSQEEQTSSSLPSNINSRLRSMRSLPNFEPDKATTGSRFAIAGLPPDLQASYAGAIPIFIFI